MARVGDLRQIKSKRKAASAFFPYAVWQERDGERKMIDAFFGLARASKSDMFLWKAIGPFIAVLFGKSSGDSLNRAITLVSPYLLPDTWSINEDMINRLEEAAFEVPYTEEIGQSVAVALLQIASVRRLQPLIPLSFWAWLKKQPSLPLAESARKPTWIGVEVVRQVRALGDVEILKSYFLFVWSGLYFPYGDSLFEVNASLAQDFCGIGMWTHRKALMRRLYYSRAQLTVQQPELPLCGIRLPQPTILCFEVFTETLKRVDREAREILNRMYFRLWTFMTSHPSGCLQNPTQNLFVLFPSRNRSRMFVMLVPHSPNSTVYWYTNFTLRRLFTVQLFTFAGVSPAIVGRVLLRPPRWTAGQYERLLHICIVSILDSFILIYCLPYYNEFPLLCFYPTVSIQCLVLQTYPSSSESWVFQYRQVGGKSRGIELEWDSSSRRPTEGTDIQAYPAHAFIKNWVGYGGAGTVSQTAKTRL